MDLHFLRLWDVYHALLTEHQREVTDLYFNCDLSLAEIAEQRGCSRQSISDTLQKARRLMEEYEGKLHFVELLAKANLEDSCRLTDLTRWAQAHLSPEQAREVQTIIDRDYSAQAERLFAENREKLI